MKNLANCKPSEFFVQSNKIRKSVAKWLTVTDIHNIRKRLPEYTDDMDAEKRAEVRNAQMKQNLSAILDAMLEEHPMETLEVMALACFIDPKEADDHPMSEYFKSVGEMIADEGVLSFFTSLVSLESSGILTLANQ